MIINRALDVADARLHYEIRGAGPLLLILGAPWAAASFAPLAEALAHDYRVVTYDRRGISGGTASFPRWNSMTESDADEAVALLAAIGAESADVLGSGYGAITGLALVARHPGRVRTLVAHEPSLPGGPSPDGAELGADATDLIIGDILATFRREGPEAAWDKFTASPEFDHTGDDPIRREMVRFEEEVPGEFHLPDATILAGGPTRVVVGVASGSGRGERRPPVILAEQIGAPLVAFPGDRDGFLQRPTQFAEVLGKVLIGEVGKGPPAR